MLVLGKGTGTHKLARGLLGKLKLTRKPLEEAGMFPRAYRTSSEVVDGRCHSGFCPPADFVPPDQIR